MTDVLTIKKKTEGEIQSANELKRSSKMNRKHLKEE